jgi:hypothetical protein
MRFGFVLGVLLKLLVGCSAVHHGAVRKLNSASPRMLQAVSDAQHVLQSAAQSDDVELRAMALSFLVAASEEDTWLKRAWMDPSPRVQRVIAEAHPLRLSDEQLVRPGADALAVARVLVGRESVSASLDWTVKAGLADDVVRALGGDQTAIGVVLDAVREGMLPPEPLLVDVLVRSGLPGMGVALAEGALNAEDEMRLPLALGAQQLAPNDGSAALAEVLRGADEMTRLFAVEALTRAGGEHAVGWLRRAVHGDSGAVRAHARLGLVALGVSKLSVAVEGLSSPDRDQRTWAAACIAMVSRKRPLPRGVVVALQRTWRDESDAVRRSVTRALVDGVGPEAVPIMQNGSPGEPDAVSVMVAGKWIETDRAKPQ